MSNIKFDDSFSFQNYKMLDFVDRVFKNYNPTKQTKIKNLKYLVTEEVLEEFETIVKGSAHQDFIENCIKEYQTKAKI